MGKRKVRRDLQDEELEEKSQYCYRCAKCGQPAQWEYTILADGYKAGKLKHEDRTIDHDHAVYPVPGIIGINCYLMGEKARLEECAEVRMCGHCAQFIVRYSKTQPWQHVDEKLTGWKFDHAATLEKLTREELEQYKTKWKAMVQIMESKMHRRAVALAPIKRREKMEVTA